MRKVSVDTAREVGVERAFKRQLREAEDPAALRAAAGRWVAELAGGGA